VQNQRERLAAGLIAAVVEQGYHSTTIADIAAAAGVSRRTFYSYFKAKEDCFLDTFEAVDELLLAAMEAAAGTERGWPAQVHARLAALILTLADNPDLVRFLFEVPPSAGGEIAERYRHLLDRVLAVVGEGRPKRTRPTSRAVEHGIAGALAALMVKKVREGDGGQLPELLPDLVELVLTPYLGRERAAQEAMR
jgi:AcrR family transcriptional regulator